MTGLGPVAQRLAGAAATATETVLPNGARAVPKVVVPTAEEAASVLANTPRVVTGAGVAATAPEVGMRMPAAVAAAAPEWTNTNWSMREAYDAIRAWSPAGVRGAVGNNLETVFEPDAWRGFVQFMNTNPSARVVDGLFENLALNTQRANGARFTAAQFAAARGLGQAAPELARAAGELSAIPRVGTSAEFANLARALGNTGLTAEHASEALKLQRSLTTLAERYPAVARAVADYAADNVTNMRAVAARAEELVRRTETPTRLLNNNVADAAQRQLARSFMGAADDIAAARILAPAAAAATPVAPGAAGAVAPGVPQAVADVLPQSADTLRRMSDGVRTSLAANDGWGRLERLARQNPALGRSVASELTRNGGQGTTEGILQTGEWLAQRAATDPRIVERTAAGGWLRNELPNMVQERLRQGMSPQQALSALDGLMRDGFPHQMLFADLKALGDGIRDQTQRTAYTRALDVWSATATP